jgi:hypothetical protein
METQLSLLRILHERHNTGILVVSLPLFHSLGKSASEDSPKEAIDLY